MPAARGLLVLCRLLPTHSQHPSWSVHCVVMPRSLRLQCGRRAGWQGPERHTECPSPRPRSPPSRKKGAAVTGSDGCLRSSSATNCRGPSGRLAAGSGPRPPRREQEGVSSDLSRPPAGQDCRLT